VYLKQAFTLVEIMIVLTIIGILTAILLPYAFQAMPNENVIKFKKANSDLINVIADMSQSAKYTLPGDLGTYPNGTLMGQSEDASTYFCESLAKELSTKSVNCITTHFGKWIDTDGDNLKSKVDYDCYAVQQDGRYVEQIVTTDGVVWYDADPALHFGYVGNFCGTNCRLYNLHPDKNGFDRIYKVFCLDVDGKEGPLDPFGYAIRADGKVIGGNRADEWINKSATDGDS